MCRISTAMHHSQREKSLVRGGKQPPPRASPDPGARCGAELAMAGPSARGLPSDQPCPDTRRGRLLALSPMASSAKVCPRERSASLQDAQHRSRVLSIPPGCPASLQGAQHPSGMSDILPGCSASLQNVRHHSRVLSIPLGCPTSFQAAQHPSGMSDIQGAQHPSGMSDIAPGCSASLWDVQHPRCSASLWDVQHPSRVLSIPLGYPTSFQGAQHPSGMSDIAPGCSASLWDVRHPGCSASLWDVRHCSRVLNIPLGYPTSLQGAQHPSRMSDIAPRCSASLWDV